jgi:hypothetical protein
MDSGAMMCVYIYIKFDKDCFRHSKFNGGEGIHRHTDTRTAWRWHMLYLFIYLFFKIRKIGQNSLQRQRTTHKYAETNTEVGIKYGHILASVN